MPLSHVGLVQPPGLNHTNVQKEGVEAPIPLFDSGGDGIALVIIVNQVAPPPPPPMFLL